MDSYLKGFDKGVSASERKDQLEAIVFDDDVDTSELAKGDILLEELEY